MSLAGNGLNLGRDPHRRGCRSPAYAGAEERLPVLLLQGHAYGLDVGASLLSAGDAVCGCESTPAKRGRLRRRDPRWVPASESASWSARGGRLRGQCADHCCVAGGVPEHVQELDKVGLEFHALEGPPKRVSFVGLDLDLDAAEHHQARLEAVPFVSRSGEDRGQHVVVRRGLRAVPVATPSTSSRCAGGRCRRCATCMASCSAAPWASGTSPSRSARRLATSRGWYLSRVRSTWTRHTFRRCSAATPA